jgi:hypothetical protein
MGSNSGSLRNKRLNVIVVEGWAEVNECNRLFTSVI